MAPKKDNAKTPEKKEYIAAFISKDKGLKLWIKGPTVEIIPGVGRHIKQGTGDFIQFVNSRYQTTDKKKIKYLLEHKYFNNRFYPDPTDPTGFWLKEGFYEEKEVKARVPVDPNAIMVEGKKQANKVASQYAEKAMSEDRVKTESLRTS